MYKIKNSSRNKKRSSKKAPLLLFVAVVVVLAAGGWWYMSRQQPIPSDEKEVVAANDNPTTETETDTPVKSPAPNSQTSRRDGGAVDTGGAGATETSGSNSSESGKVTVYTPGTNSLIKSGSTISGASTLSSVAYRLIDDKIGVVANGTLKVVGGKFSGTFDFTSAGTEGRLDVFNRLPDGRETDVVEISVRYR